MTGRKWESEVDDASRYCQITRRMHQIRPFLQPVLVISLASFSLVNFTSTKVCVGGEGRRPSASHLPKKPSHCGKFQHNLYSSLTLANCRRKFSLSIYLLEALIFLTRHSETKTSPSPAALMYVQPMRQFYASARVTPSAQMGPFKSEDIIFLQWRKRKRGKQWVEDESWSTRTKKRAICTDQLSQRERARFNAFEGKPWCAMSLSSSLSFSIIAVIFPNQVKMRNEFNNTWLRQHRF